MTSGQFFWLQFPVWQKIHPKINYLSYKNHGTPVTENEVYFFFLSDFSEIII